MDISNLRAEDVIIEEELSYYKSGMEFLHLQLTHLSVNIYILDHVLTFPFHLFSDSTDSLFFRMVFENFFYVSLLIITRLATDQGSDLLTLLRFKNRIRLAVKPEYQKKFDERLGKVRFDENTRSTFDKAHKLRHERVAHNINDIALGDEEETIVTFGEIKSMRDNLVSLFDALAFNTKHYMLPIPYHPGIQNPPGMDNRTDIQVILDSIAERSALLNLPEKNPEVWKQWKSDYSEEDLNLINKYRRKFNLPDA